MAGEVAVVPIADISTHLETVGREINDGLWALRQRGIQVLMPDVKIDIFALIEANAIDSILTRAAGSTTDSDVTVHGASTDTATHAAASSVTSHAAATDTVTQAAATDVTTHAAATDTTTHAESTDTEASTPPGQTAVNTASGVDTHGVISTFNWYDPLGPP